MSSVPLNARRVEVADSFQAIQDYCWEQGWTDGLPVVPPTEPLVRDMLASYGGAPSLSLGTLQPRNAQATLEKLAINAVMAGCRPEYFPVVVAAVKAALDKDFNLGGNAATTGGAAQVVIVNGPIAKELGINGDAACFGPGFRANAAIGRALRLIIRNVAGLIPGDMDKATLATPGRYSFCFSENEERSPWEPRNVQLGYAAGSSTVTVAGIRGVYTIMETTVPTGLEILETFVGNMKAVGISNYYQIGTGAQIIMVICPEHADEIAAAGLSKSDVQEYIFQNARMPMHMLTGRAHYGNRNWPSWVDESNPETQVPIVSAAEDVAVIVAGGDGRHSAWLAGWGVTRMKTEEIVKHA
ncbi:MAG: hypothetical protein HQ475_04480 [SAR202 cluster bacterium]|nr:hypothetical protein [SAR202 cluster bacterium]